LRLPTIVLAAVLLLALGAQAQFYEWSAGPLQASKLSTVAFKGWLPERSEPHDPLHGLERELTF